MGAISIDFIRGSTLVGLALLALPAGAEVCTAIRHEMLTVKADREQWTSAALKIHPRDVILVYASGRVQTTAAAAPVGPKGFADGDGELEMKVGTGTVVPTGSRWFGSFRDYGTLMFRVAGHHREALAGSFRVNLVVIPADTFPDPVQLDTE